MNTVQGALNRSLIWFMGDSWQAHHRRNTHLDIWNWLFDNQSMAWVKRNKLVAFLIIVIAFLLSKNFFLSFLGLSVGSLYRQRAVTSSTGEMAIGQKMPAAAESLSFGRGIIPPPAPDYAPSESQERLVVEESSMSMVVAEVRETANKVIDQAQKVGGFMVSSSLDRPEESPFAVVVIRVPADKFRETLDYFRSLTIRVTSEKILGTDVTAQYEDITAKIETYEKTKAKFEEILERATQIQDILSVQRELINLQSQIDSLKGRQKYLEQTAKLAKITAYLATDEWALPYTPSKPFRPQVIFKQAVRSLVLTLRGLAAKIIWIGVYSIIWGPVLVGYFLFRHWRKRKTL